MKCGMCKEEEIPGHLYVMSEKDPESILCAKCCNQPERSKREDSEYGAKCDFGILKSEMRCSEHCGNTVRDK